MNGEHPNNLAGMSAAEAKEYILGFVTTLKLTEKEIRSLESEAEKWKNRAELARSKESDELFCEAGKEAERITHKLVSLRAERDGLINQIDLVKKQLPALAAGERSIDPLLLEQELLTALGKTGEELKTDRAFRELEKEEKAAAALEELKGRKT